MSFLKTNNLFLFVKDIRETKFLRVIYIHFVYLFIYFRIILKKEINKIIYLYHKIIEIVIWNINQLKS